MTNKERPQMMKNLSRIFSLISLLAGGLIPLKLKLSRLSIVVMGLKLLVSTLSPYTALAGALGVVLGLWSKDLFSIIAGAAGATIAARYMQRTTASHDGFERAFGSDWQREIASKRLLNTLARRWTWRIPGEPVPRIERDVTFHTIGDRHLRCDIWQPAESVPPSGLAFIYFHGGSWHSGDKGEGIGPLFTHLTAQGHVVMDVAYRLCPEIDIVDMVGDAKRAIAWMKRSSEQYKVNPARIVVAGGSAGGHLALLAAYTPDHPDLTPDGLSDVSVRAVVSFYGPPDLRASYEYGRDFKGFDTAEGSKKAIPSTQKKYENLLGGPPEDSPAMFDLASPVTHVSADAPPTLMFYGDHDSWVPVDAPRALYRKLVDAGVPVVYVEFPQTEHAFDLVLPKLSPPAQALLYDLDRFLALMV